MFKKTSSAGVSAHVLSPEAGLSSALRSRRLMLAWATRVEMMHSLSMASEAGANLIAEMSKDKELARYKDDPRILMLVQNAKALKYGGTGLAQLGTIPTIPSYEAPSV